MNEEKKITNSKRLALIERYLYGEDSDGNRLSAGNQKGISLRARLQENITGQSARLHPYTIKEVVNKIEGLDKDLKKMREVQNYIFSLLIGACIGVVVAWTVSVFL